MCDWDRRAGLEDLVVRLPLELPDNSNERRVSMEELRMTLPLPDDRLNQRRRSSTQNKLSKNALNELVKARKEANKRQQVSFGVMFDIDGVLARGTRALPGTRKAFQMLCDNKGELRIPTVFVSNSLNKNSDKAAQISGWAGVEITASQMIQCQGPLEVFTEYHHKFCLIVGQGKIWDIATELGFTNFCTLDDVAEAYPLLDVVDHDNRKRNAEQGYVEKDFPRIEAIVMLGEPKKWDQALQLLVDLLVTDGKPDHAPETYPEVHLPIVACNMDLQFMDLACMPRYGHGAFLVCLETLYEKVTGHELKYTALIGKPSEITFRFAEHCVSREAKKMGITTPIKTLYLLGDTPEVDIVGSNLYQRYLDRLHDRRDNNMYIEAEDNSKQSKKKKDLECDDPELPSSRNMPPDADFSDQTVQKINSILVCTGVYRPERMDLSAMGEDKHSKGHRDFPVTSDLYKPTKVAEDVEKAIEYILTKENALWQT